MNDKKHLLICSCGSCEHQAILSYWHDEDYPEVYLSIHLITWEGFWRRLWTGLRYAFGYKSKYGHFDEMVITPEEAKNIRDFFADVGFLAEVTIK